jgi:predicted phosphodiesterase
MRVWATSDIHIDYPENRQWLEQLSDSDYRDDILILAGDISHQLEHIRYCFELVSQKFKRVFFVPGNHELWVRHEKAGDSIEKFLRVLEIASEYQVDTQVRSVEGLTIVPLFSWYDFSFGEPSKKLLDAWMDFRCCSWPEGLDPCEYFLSLNTARIAQKKDKVLSFSHFLPRIDVMPDRIPPEKRFIYPVLGSAKLDTQLRLLAPQVHVYGHSHVNRDVVIDGVRYINSAYAYPSETRISSKSLKRIHM